MSSNSPTSDGSTAGGAGGPILAGPAIGLDPDAPGRYKLTWLVQLHWFAILGQLLILGISEVWSEVRLPVGPVVVLLAVEAWGNLVLGAWARRGHVTEVVIAAVMGLDAVVLTILLDLTGGAANPFSTLYLVNVALGAVLLPRRWSWALMVVSLLGFASLFLHEQLSEPFHHIRTGLTPEQLLEAHLKTMWIALALAAIFIVYFVRRVALELADRERDLREARARAERREKLASLATLAAGAAHELSTPLSTITVVVKELERALAGGGNEEVRRDLQLVRDQVARCREILDRMAAHSGEQVGEPLAQQPVSDWVQSALATFPSRGQVRVEAAPEDGAALIVGPPRALSDALRGLLKNAVQASGPGLPVVLRIARMNGRVSATVVDQGRGMPADVLDRVGEPFFTTKVPGEGMGLGLFLTRTLAEQLGGEFHITSRPALGTEARIELPTVSAGERSST